MNTGSTPQKSPVESDGYPVSSVQLDFKLEVANGIWAEKLESGKDVGRVLGSSKEFVRVDLYIPWFGPGEHLQVFVNGTLAHRIPLHHVHRWL